LISLAKSGSGGQDAWMATPGTQEWLDQVIEDVIDPDLEIIDPHHHLWPVGQGLPYQRDETAPLPNTCAHSARRGTSPIKPSRTPSR